ncbi:MAG TPA: carboxypeptidase regulatory-like domain-containing protein [Candidatus Dormibacteraeota bacterium]|nr:carboxypeptidase regulatory-like domain-containing protein [Candidatus Dormibacteraeota bacterium]
MLRLSLRVVGKLCLLLLLVSFAANSALAQLETATISGQVVDPSGMSVAGAHVKLVDIDRDTSTSATTNGSGLYTFPAVRPGRYRIEVTSAGFKVVNVTGLIVNVQDHIEQNFRVQVGSVAESVTVTAGAPLVNTTDATVSTVVNRQFAENIPLNGRSFQSLIQLTPGVVLTANNSVDTGQFSVNGQRANSNYWMVDGVSANIGISANANPGSGLAGTLGSASVLGGTNSLVSVDALQEFRIQTSTYAPEFGRTPGGQISIVTRSGTNQFHGTAFDYFRNDVLDANDWFADQKGLPKPQERQNDFGGTFSGPIVKDKTFFFFSYEGLRLRLPQTALTLVPDTNPMDPYSRQFANADIVPYLNAFPQPNGPQAVDTQGNPIPGVAQFNGSYSDPATLNAYSIRVDHKINDRLNLFGRYNYSPSELSQRGSGGTPLSTVSPTTITTQTGTVGATWAMSPIAANDFRFNYSSTDASGSRRLDNFGKAVPLGTLPLPSPFTAQNALFNFEVFTLGANQSLIAGESVHNQQRQLNVVDSVAIQKGSHSLKVGTDYRRLSPLFSPEAYEQLNLFSDIPSAETGTTLLSQLNSNLPVTFLFRNLGAFAQDTWHVAPRLTITYGLRWDVDFVPSTLNGPKFNAVTGFNLSNLSNLALLPPGTPPYKTRWGNLAPRIGLAYQVSESQSWQTVLRGGFGLFYGLATSEAGAVGVNGYPFGSQAYIYGIPLGGTATFPLSPDNAKPPQIAPPNASDGGSLNAFDPNLVLPYTLQWNVAVEQALGKQQTLSISYLGAAGRRLIQTAGVATPNLNLQSAYLVMNAGTSDYNALQLQFQRRLSRGLQALASYSWSHSLDTASAGSFGSGSNLLSALNSNVNRGPSDFDVRNALSIALTYDVPMPKGNALTSAILRGWSTENIIQARSAPPIDVYYSGFSQLSNGFQTSVRPDVVVGQPFYLQGSQYPGGKAFNPAAFTSPPLTPPGCVPGVNFPCLPTRQGDLPRNALRSFGAAQWDFAVHREFPIHESLKLQFRAEMFNVLNHPNFGPPVADLGTPGALNSQFGQSLYMLGKSLAGGNLGSGAFDPLYQLGGPRSIQFALKLSF